MSLVNVEHLREIAEVEFADIVVEAFIPDVNELRLSQTLSQRERNQRCGESPE